MSRLRFSNRSLLRYAASVLSRTACASAISEISFAYAVQSLAQSLNEDLKPWTVASTSIATINSIIAPWLSGLLPERPGKMTSPSRGNRSS